MYPKRQAEQSTTEGRDLIQRLTRSQARRLEQERKSELPFRGNADPTSRDAEPSFSIQARRGQPALVVDTELAEKWLDKGYLPALEDDDSSPEEEPEGYDLYSPTVRERYLQAAASYMDDIKQDIDDIYAMVAIFEDEVDVFQSKLLNANEMVDFFSQDLNGLRDAHDTVPHFEKRENAKYIGLLEAEVEQRISVLLAIFNTLEKKAHKSDDMRLALKRTLQERGTETRARAAPAKASNTEKDCCDCVNNNCAGKVSNKLCEEMSESF